MPNNTKNRLRVSNWENKNLLKEVKEAILNETKVLDFNKVIPQPENIFNGSLGSKEKEMCEKEGRPNWCDWNTENWGTKWNAYGFEMIVDNDYELMFDFETAWSTPTPVMNKIFDLAKGCTVEFLSICEGGFFAVSILIEEDGIKIEKDLKDFHRELIFALNK